MRRDVYSDSTLLNGHWPSGSVEYCSDFDLVHSIVLIAYLVVFLMSSELHWILRTGRRFTRTRYLLASEEENTWSASFSGSTHGLLKRHIQASEEEKTGSLNSGPFSAWNTLLIQRLSTVWRDLAESGAVWFYSCSKQRRGWTSVWFEKQRDGWRDCSM